jgi:putative endonuclease
MKSNKDLGFFGEEQASNYLKDNGYKILVRNFYSYQGEIDIVAKDKDEYVFCEVKTRTNFKYGRPIEAVNYYKKKHILSATNYYLYKNNMNNIFVRFDIIEVVVRDNNFKINHIKNIM